MDVVAPLYRFADTAAVAGMSPGAVRRLFADYRMISMAAPSRRAVRLCLLDVLRLRVLRQLLDAGLSLQNAVYCLDLSVDPVLGGMAGCGVAVDLAFLRQRVADRSFFVVPDECDENPDLFSVPAGSPAPTYAESATAIHLEPILAAVLTELAATQTRRVAGQESNS